MEQRLKKKKSETDFAYTKYFKLIGVWTNLHFRTEMLADICFLS